MWLMVLGSYHPWEDLSSGMANDEAFRAIWLLAVEPDQEELQKVKLASKKLLSRLKEEKSTVLVHDWHKDTQTRNQVKGVIEKILDEYLPDPAYNRTLFASKSNQVFEHFFMMASNGNERAVAWFSCRLHLEKKQQ